MPDPLARMVDVHIRVGDAQLAVCDVFLEFIHERVPPRDLAVEGTAEGLRGYVWDQTGFRLDDVTGGQSPAHIAQGIAFVEDGIHDVEERGCVFLHIFIGTPQEFQRVRIVVDDPLPEVRRAHQRACTGQEQIGEHVQVVKMGVHVVIKIMGRIIQSRKEQGQDLLQIQEAADLLAVGQLLGVIQAEYMVDPKRRLRGFQAGQQMEQELTVRLQQHAQMPVRHMALLEDHPVQVVVDLRLRVKRCAGGLCSLCGLRRVAECGRSGRGEVLWESQDEVFHVLPAVIGILPDVVDVVILKECPVLLGGEADELRDLLEEGEIFQLSFAAYIFVHGGTVCIAVLDHGIYVDIFFLDQFLERF